MPIATSNAAQTPPVATQRMDLLRVRHLKLLQLVATTGSLTWAWRQSAGTVVYVGASRERSGLAPGLARHTEAFIKLQVDADDLRRAWP